jgi:hypothetical protein
MLHRTASSPLIVPIFCGFALGALCFAASDSAWASCVPTPSALLWSYPANGATNVPTNADLFITGSPLGVPTLDGLPLQRLAGDSFELGQLAPQTTYEIRWATAVIAFTTGDRAGPETPADLLSNDVLLTRNPEYSTQCPLVDSQSCFDVGPPTRVRWEPSAARVWLVEKLRCDGSTTTLLWPSECGPPVILDYGIICASVRGSNGQGLSDPTGVFCSVPNVPLETLPRYNTCVGDWPAAGAATVAGDDGVTVGSISGRNEAEESSSDTPGFVDNTPDIPGNTTDPPNFDATPGASIAARDSAAPSGGGCSVAHARSSGGASLAGFAALCAFAATLTARRRPRRPLR